MTTAAALVTALALVLPVAPEAARAESSASLQASSSDASGTSSSSGAEGSGDGADATGPDAGSDGADSSGDAGAAAEGDEADTAEASADASGSESDGDSNDDPNGEASSEADSKQTPEITTRAATKGTATFTVRTVGLSRVGKLLRAIAKPIKSKTALPKVTYRWYRSDPKGTIHVDGGAWTRIPGEAGETVMMTAKELGHTIRVVAVDKANNVTVPAINKAKIAKGVLPKLKPKLSGQLKVEKKLKLSFSAKAVGTKTISWYRNSTKLRAHGTIYTLTAKDLGKRIRVHVTQKATAYQGRAEKSAKTAKITTLGTLSATKPKVKGIVTSVSTLKTTRGTWTDGTKLSYQWYSGSSKIAGATGRSLKLTSAQRGRVIRMKVTGKLTGYKTKSMVSAPAEIQGLTTKKNAKGWSWPTDVFKVNQGYHDGYSLDLASTAGGPVFSPYSGTVVTAGNDGGGVPWVCVVNPGWWHGANQTVIIKHKYKGKTIYSSVNHVAPGSTAALGIKAGTKVKAGQQIATEGMSGCTSGPHNHFLMKKTAGNYWGDVKPYGYIGKPK